MVLGLVLAIVPFLYQSTAPLYQALQPNLFTGGVLLLVVGTSGYISTREEPLEPYVVAMAVGVALLVFVGAITLYDVTVWGKDIATILFDSRTREALSLGIGFRLLYYLLIGVGLLLSGFLAFLRRR